MTNLFKTVAFAAVLVCISGQAWSAEVPAGNNGGTRPEWAANYEPVAIRGVLGHDKATYFIQTPKSIQWYIVGQEPRDIEKFLGLNVEIKGWMSAPGAERKLQAAQPAQPPQVLVPAWWSLPFILLLACIALIPLLNKHFWEKRHHQIALGLGAVMVLVYCAALGRYGPERMLQTAEEYFKFIALIGSLFVVTGGIFVDISGRGRPVVNTLLLLAGACLANIIGTTGASALLIRPYLRINRERIRPFHVVFFIFIVSNCGGCLTPIGDPPLFLGYLYGVPFLWPLKNCLPAWALAAGLLLAIFFVLDCLASIKAANKDTYATSKGANWDTRASNGGVEKTRVHVSGSINFACLAVILFAVFLDELLAGHVSPVFEHIPAGALLMVAAAFASYKLARPENLARNEFSFGPIKEVAYLFAGIFATMVPALDYLAVNAEQLGITTPGGFYWAAGALSSFLDNAPTYLNFLSAAHGLKGIVLSPANMPDFIGCWGTYLLAVSLGSVFFGACTYIGNGPNFMVKAIADAAGVETPSFLGYIFKYTLWFLLPVYALVWFLFFVRG